MHLDPTLPAIVGALLGILLLAVALKRLGQPHVIGYLLAGVVLGPEGLGLVTDEVVLDRMGAWGVVLLLFFVGMEVSPRELARGWKVAVIGTLCQIAVSVAGMWVIGLWRGAGFEKVLLFGFVISLSSTAVVLKLLDDAGELRTPVGRDALGILLVQDMALIPMLIVVAALGGEVVGPHEAVVALLGAVAVVGILAWVFRRGTVSLPFRAAIRADHEIQVFAALVLCFGLALLTGLMGLSTALGAFVAGILVGAARETQWVHDSLSPFRVVFVALFFVSIGMLVDVRFIGAHWPVVLTLVVLVLVSKTAINTLVLRMLGDPWPRSVYAGALLAQIGEFSYVLAAVGLQAGLVGTADYQLAVAVISLSLVASPAWIHLARRLTGGRDAA
jgi:CPA2 family monovalent cation:H+ antiporter-2